MSSPENKLITVFKILFLERKIVSHLAISIEDDYVLLENNKKIPKSSQSHRYAGSCLEANQIYLAAIENSIMAHERSLNHLKEQAVVLKNEIQTLKEDNKN